MTQRRDRTDDKDADQQQLTPFQEECKQILSERLQYGKVVSGKSFGAHLHCYKNKDCDDADDNNEKRNQQKKHEHGETVVLCVDEDENDDKQASSSQSTLASDLRYLSVASRVANTARKRFFVAFRENDDSSQKVENDDDEKSTKKKKGIKMLELTTLTV